ncbi:MAG: sigma 54-interacting transcriptional regulator [Desulfonauticus sp.]|nr:sigma 54-interacting transcriptional regulator [Desulfonauticus sp.]
MPVKTHLIGAESILESISDGVFTVDLNWRITYFNRAAEEITGLKKDEVLGKLCAEVFRSSMCETDCALRQTLKTGRPIIGKTTYIIDFNGNKIPISVSTAVLRDSQGKIIGGAETFRDLSELESLRQKLEGKYKVGNLISRSPKMQQIFEILPAISESSSTVLILGETGTGKEVIARTIHNLSPRKDNPFIALNCGALPENLLESELFGYKKGAFTGATKDKPGRFVLAHKGTLFLDEVAEMPLITQVKLLRVLQEKTFEPLGGTSSQTVDVRIIAATNQDLKQLVQEKKFREDLYYRLNVIKIELPPLRERKEDIPLLVQFFIKRLNRIEKKSIQGIEPEALSLLMAYHWPGNIRELENIIERAFILCQEKMIQTTHLPEEIVSIKRFTPEISDLKKNKQEMEKEIILKVLKKNNYNKTATAKELGIHKTTLFRKLKKFNIV